MKLRYVFSAPAMLRLQPNKWAVDNPDEYEGITKIINEGLQKIKKSLYVNKDVIDEFEVDILFNAYTENNVGEFIRMNDNFGFSKLFADSGGLQMITQGKTVTHEIKSEIYNVQKIADIAMCFDVIPVEKFKGVTVARSRVTDKVYDPNKAAYCAKETALNIKNQIDSLIDSTSKVSYIIQGNNYQDMVEWFDVGVTELGPELINNIAGLSLADTCIGNGEKESIDMLVAYHLLNKKYGRDIIKDHVHLLGVGSSSRLKPLFYLSKNGFLNNDTTFSFDSTTISMSIIQGKYENENGAINSDNLIEIRKELIDSLEFYSDIMKKYFDNFDIEYIADHMISNIKSTADMINKADNIHYQSIIRAMVPLLCFKRLLYFSKRIDNIIKSVDSDPSPMGMLRYVKDMDDFKRWNDDFGRYMQSKRIYRHGNNLDNLFGE
ncbi:MAG: hypothetical protein PHC28_10310 [Flavobacterium sp.]|uniref:hypothetical protein n=1 Tax=Flavobacterium sp. TaxID=239 RepID=UPI0026359958|nr:hypothetical protein [Flavobacterium sp.]MDD5150850.1 hypothetical protein [Flavobacterium sp.]